MRGIDEAANPSVQGFDLAKFGVEHPDKLDRLLGRGRYSRP